MDSQLFEIWFEHRLPPALTSGSAIIMDNAAFHRKARHIPLAENYGYHLVFLLPYSPGSKQDCEKPLPVPLILSLPCVVLFKLFDYNLGLDGVLHFY